MNSTIASNWRTTRKPAVTAAWVLACLLAMACALELAARMPWWTAAVGPPSYGTRLRFFDLQLARLQELARKHEVDCVFLGSSAVINGLNPTVFADAYAAKAGWRPNCFNFGLPGATIYDVRALAPALIRDYPLKLIVYPVAARDVSRSALGPQIGGSPWLRDPNGVFDIDVTLTQTSAAFRYFLLFRHWLAPSVSEAYVNDPPGEDGFYGSTRTLAADELLTGGSYFISTRGGDYDVSAFSDFAASAAHGAKLFVAELPNPPAARNGGGNKWREGFGAIIAELAEISTRAGGTFVGAPGDNVMPTDGWADLVHMNARGAEAFSRWLGQRCGTPSDPARRKTS